MHIPALQVLRSPLASRSLGRDATSTLVGALLLAASAQVSVPLAPFGVPFTLQAHTVLILAAALGRRPAVAAVASYLAAGALGAPVFAGLQAGPLHLMGPRCGYLWGFLATAWWLGGAARPVALWRWAAASLATLAFGWLGLVPWLGARAAWQAGVSPFVLADLAKAVACWLGFAAWRSRRPAGGVSAAEHPALPQTSDERLGRPRQAQPSGG